MQLSHRLSLSFALLRAKGLFYALSASISYSSTYLRAKNGAASEAALPGLGEGTYRALPHLRPGLGPESCSPRLAGVSTRAAATLSGTAGQRLDLSLLPDPHSGDSRVSPPYLGLLLL